MHLKTLALVIARSRRRRGNLSSVDHLLIIQGNPCFLPGLRAVVAALLPYLFEGCSTTYAPFQFLKMIYGVRFIRLCRFVGRELSLMTICPEILRVVSLLV